VREMIPEEPGQFGMDRYDPAVSLGPVLELAPVPRAPVIGPLAACIGRCSANVQLAPAFIFWKVLRLPTVPVPHLGREDHVVGGKVDRFLRAQLRFAPVRSPVSGCYAVNRRFNW
jgi:hypothetical protein